MGIAAAADVLETLSVAAFFLFLPLAIAGQISLVLRFRRARGHGAPASWWPMRSGHRRLPAAPPAELSGRSLLPRRVVVDLLGNVPIIAVPVALGIAVLRYRLYDIDQLISRT